MQYSPPHSHPTHRLMPFELDQAHLDKALRSVAGSDPDVAAALERHGFPAERRSGAPGFGHLLKVLAGQQLSVRAAATIHERLLARIGDPPLPAALLLEEDADLRAIGLSRQKIGYARALAEAIESGRFDPESLHDKADSEVIAALTSLKGFGVWSAQMVLLFSLGRPDVWPVDDLGVRAGLQRLKNLPSRPDAREADRIGRAWSPHRSAMALLMWHLHGQPEE
ncbi:DNA-3-methyladenine glycosylase 2 family protein [Wenzhouxiangella sp. XN79A]|uniref:DNA-3-methyladenine glycosylase family protein n=1 Tax=Wenzhouxiangella sp. XN79A TaxID=2724193 RepID=UPI00144A857A|nr:DNA-3-methyladenine glycosylase 2 family protein [Wenzhouxiangella sp. XN79A]NKI34505.1 DNA-3-methyladenine glycosylase 2 family protein [Wenzhouxiangella sp. XN79A]